MEAADNYYVPVAQFSGKVLGLKNQIARTLDRAKKGQRLLPQNIQVTKREDASRGLVAKIFPQSGGIPHIRPVNGLYNHQEFCPRLAATLAHVFV